MKVVKNGSGRKDELTHTVSLEGKHQRQKMSKIRKRKGKNNLCKDWLEKRWS